MANTNILKAGALLFTGLSVCVLQMVWIPASEAVTFNIKNNAKAQISIRVGAGGKNVSTVDFTVPVTELGNGTPLTSPIPIKIRLAVRGTAGNPVTGILSANSFTHPLTNSNGNTLPFSDISWVASNGNIPPGSFNQDTTQILATFQSPDRIDDILIFSYANTLSTAAGTYNGRVVYTWAAP